MLRSMTDEQLLQKYGYDKEPWVSWSFKSGDDFRLSEEPTNRPSRFAPRPECIPSRDPLPFLTGLGGRCAGPTFKFFNATAPGYFSPRREFARPGVNPILSEFRYALSTRSDLAYMPSVFAAEWLGANTLSHWAVSMPAQTDHARKVLTRLAAL